MKYIKKLASGANLFFLLLFIFLVFIKYPEFKKNSDQQGSRIQERYEFVDLITNEKFAFPSFRRQVVVFWATWCAPCKVELARINNLIEIKKLRPDQVVAVSLDQNRSDIEATLKSATYRFLVGHDLNGKVGQAFEVVSTPTILFVDENNVVYWRTSGISPSLEARILSFFN
ncbi:MAG: TlpA family protein disulfide reductase [Bdellovibrionales bacterium]